MPFIGKGEDTCSHAAVSLSHHRQARHIPEGAHVPGAGLQRPTLSSATPSSRPARKPDPAEVQDRVASAPKEGPAGFRAGLGPSRPEELGPNRALAGKLGRGYSQLPEKRQPGVHLVLSKLRPAPAPRADQTGPRGLPAGGSGACGGTARRDPLPGRRWARSLSPVPHSPGVQGPASLGPQLAAAGHLSAKSCLWPAVLACGHFKSAAEKGPGSLSPRTWGGGGAPAEPRPCTWCPIGLFTLAHTALLVARTTPAPGTSFAGAPKMSPPRPPGLGCGAAAGSVSRGVADLPDLISGATPPPPPAVAMVPGRGLGLAEA